MLAIHQYLNNMKKVQKNILEYIESNQNNDDSFERFCILYNNFKTHSESYDLKSILYLISDISNNHYRGIDFFGKIFNILLFLKNDIQENFSNNDIFNIFKNNKRVLLFLFEEKIINIDKYFFSNIMKFKEENYAQFFFNEIKPFIDQDKIDECSKELPENYNELRKAGENDLYICQLIQKDLVNEFIIHVNQTNFPIISYRIKPSIFETNSFLLSANPTLIEYAAFFGSIQIFKYLFINNAQISPSLWLYAIHGSNPDIIHFLEENHIEPDNAKYKEILNESIKCHHNDIANYISENIIENEDKDVSDFISNCLKSYNFNLIDISLINQKYFEEFCEYDYFFIVKNLLQTDDFDINAPIISNVIFIYIITILSFIHDVLLILYSNDIQFFCFSS